MSIEMTVSNESAQNTKDVARNLTRVLMLGKHEPRLVILGVPDLHAPILGPVGGMSSLRVVILSGSPTTYPDPSAPSTARYPNT